MSGQSRLLEFLARRGYAPAEIADSDDLFAAGVLNSISSVQLALFLETEYGIKMRPGEITYDRFRSVAAIEKFVAEKRK